MRLTREEIFHNMKIVGYMMSPFKDHPLKIILSDLKIHMMRHKTSRLHFIAIIELMNKGEWFEDPLVIRKKSDVVSHKNIEAVRKSMRYSQADYKTDFITTCINQFNPQLFASELDDALEFLTNRKMEIAR